MRYKIIYLKLENLNYAIIDNKLNKILERFETINQANQYIKEL